MSFVIVDVEADGPIPAEFSTDGAKFDSSVDRDEPFTFVLGTGQVIQGWDEGVAAMRVGDKARLTIPPELACGEAGYPGAVASRRAPGMSSWAVSASTSIFPPAPRISPPARRLGVGAL